MILKITTFGILLPFVCYCTNLILGSLRVIDNGYFYFKKITEKTIVIFDTQRYINLRSERDLLIKEVIK